jgi:hypothetical protein
LHIAASWVQTRRDLYAFSILIDLNIDVKGLFEHAREPRQHGLTIASMLLHMEEKAVKDRIIARLEAVLF